MSNTPQQESMSSEGRLKNFSLRLPVDDHGFLDFCFYVIREHQYHVSMHYLSKETNKKYVSRVSRSEEKNVSTSGEKCGESAVKEFFF